MALGGQQAKRKMSVTAVRLCLTEAVQAFILKGIRTPVFRLPLLTLPWRCALEVRRNRSWAIGAILFAGLGLLLPPLQAAGLEWADASPQQLQIEAEQLEDGGQWTRAAELWYQILSKDRAIAYVRQHHHYCLPRAQQVARHQVASYRLQVAALSLVAALRV